MPCVARTFVLACLLATAAHADSTKQDEPPELKGPTREQPTTEDATPRIEEHVPGKGVRLSYGGMGELTFSLYTSIRYLNQRLLESTYTYSDGMTIPLDRRDDIEFQKVILYFKGWLAVPEFRYLTYVWTSNASQGLGAQVIVAGNLTYRFHRAFAIGSGIGSLPTTRSTRGTFPKWLKQDNRTVADEYFRGSYTTGIWAWGSVVPDRLHYHAMVGNNLSQLGVDGGQLDMGLETYSGALWWTTSNFAPYEGFGDVEHHESPAAVVGAAFTQSREDRQSQPGTEAPDNSQIRISDGQIIFTPGVFGPGTAINRATYRMASVDAEVKYRGLSLEGELYYRWIDSIDAIGPLPISELRDWGFQLQGSAMVVPKRFMVYLSGSTVRGEYGNPWDLGFGVNYFVFDNRVLRVNAEAIMVDRSPVGNLSSPLIVGADGVVFVANVELFF